VMLSIVHSMHSIMRYVRALVKSPVARTWAARIVIARFHHRKTANVAHVSGEVEEVDQLLPALYLEQKVGRVEHRLRLREQLRERELLEHVVVVEVDEHLLRRDALDELVLHPVVVAVVLA
jgi:methyl coenzyme M reductase subunit C-like uncharacterized protein (methanogenesis marker protein 7)